MSTRSQNDFASGSSRPKTRTAGAASTCVACRSRHLKCDGLQPCTRCVSSGSQCHYIASRRGFRKPRKSPAVDASSKTQGTTTSSPFEATSIGLTPATSQDEFVSDAGDITSSTEMLSDVLNMPQDNGQISTPISMQMYDLFDSIMMPNNALFPTTEEQGVLVTQDALPDNEAEDKLLESFYYYFFASHPFVLPRLAFLSTARNGNVPLVAAAMRWIGSLYLQLSNGEQDKLYQRASKGVQDIRNPRDGFLVQALLLIAIGLDGQGQLERAREIMFEAQNVALEIQMHTKLFAETNGRTSPTLAESWRRTWWNLYVTDAMISGVHRVTNFALFDVVSDVDIPCEEDEYSTENFPSPMSLQDILDEDFVDDDRPFSSFAYRILACRNLGHFMRTPPIIDPDDINIAKLEARLTNWRLQLSPSKRDAVLKDGAVDEMMFQAHMMTHATSILLHQPHSLLDAPSTENINSCAPHPGASGRVFRDHLNGHAKHTVASASAISDMVTMRTPLTHHTHFFACVITLSSIVHLSYWAHYCGQDNDTLKQQIRLNVGALKQLAQIWPSAEMAHGQVKSTARDIFRARQLPEQLTFSKGT